MPTIMDAHRIEGGVAATDVAEGTRADLAARAERGGDA